VARAAGVGDAAGAAARARCGCATCPTRDGQRPGDLVDGELVLRAETGGVDGAVFDVSRARAPDRPGRRPAQRAGVGVLEWHLEEGAVPALGARALRLLVAHGFGDGRLHRIEAHVDPADLRTLRLLSHAGLRREGILRGHARAGGERVTGC
jgi:hypothetical protein